MKEGQFRKRQKSETPFLKILLFRMQLVPLHHGGQRGVPQHAGVAGWRGPANRQGALYKLHAVSPQLESVMASQPLKHIK
jgi:hypothetical protein